MAFNNGFPVTYPQPQYYVPQQTQPQMQQNGGLIWIQGEAGAKSYLVAPNNTVPLWDSESQTIYLKSADASGMPTMKILDYTVREANTQVTPALMRNGNEDYVTKDEFSAFVDNVKKQIEQLKGGTSDGKSDF